MSAFTIQLPAGTNVKHMINLPMSGGWLGSVYVSLATTTANATVHELLFIWDNGPETPKRYRRAGGTSAQNWQNWTLTPDARPPWLLYNLESMMTIRYTSSNNISACIETNRNVAARPYPSAPGPISEWEGTIYYATP